MIKIHWAYIPDYRKSGFLDQVDLIVVYSGKRYVALNVKHLTIESLERQIPDMITALKDDMRKERHGRALRKMRHPAARR